MSTIQRVAVAGAGLIGKPVIQALVDANFTVKALTRAGSEKTLPSSVEVAKVDYGDAESLANALQGQDAVVSTIASSALSQQEALFDAAIKAGVKRLIPSEFGSNLSNPKTRALPMYTDKIQIQEYLAEKTRGTQSSYTIIYNNLFLDGAIDLNFIMSLKDKKIEIFNGGETVYTTTPLPFVAKGVVGVLQHPAETANRPVYLHGVGITQKKVLEIAQRVVGKDGWEISEADTVELEKKGYENFKNDPGNSWGWVMPMLKNAIFDERYGCDFSQNNDNELLGLKELSEQEVEDVIRSRA